MKVLYKQGHVCISVILEPRPSAHVIIVMNMEVDKIFCIVSAKHRKNCECCPGHHLIVDHYFSI